MVEEIGAPVELAGAERDRGDDRDAGGDVRSASRSERSRVTKAWPASPAAYAVLNGQLPVPSYDAS